MFFEADQINEILSCKRCNAKLDEPIILPCSESICSHCAKLIELIDQKHFKCICCNSQHDMPNEGLPIPKTLVDVLTLKPKEVSRGKIFDTFQELLNSIKKKMFSIKHSITNGNDKIQEYCLDLRTDVYLATEEAVQQLNDLSDELIQEIDDYEDECIRSLQLNQNLLQNFNKIANDLELFYNLNSHYVKQLQINENDLEQANQVGIKLNQLAEDEQNKIESLVFNGRILKFDKNKTKLNTQSNNIIGKLFNLKTINSFILLHRQKELMELCEFPVDQKWNLIYRATQDGFRANDFHSKCDNKPNTLIIIKVTSGCVFGGYTEKDWSGTGYKEDPNAFIFSLINLTHRPIKMRCTLSAHAIYCSTIHGPVFGGGYDFQIKTNSNLNFDSSSNLGNRYKHPDYAYGSEESKSFLAGSHNFQTVEIEVYTKGF
jgi:hypothetical protein